MNEPALINAIKSSRPILLCSWHSRLVFVARYFKNSPYNLWGISSSHRDSEIMARILQGWRWSLIRGSSTRGWRKVIKSMIELFKEPKTIIAVTNDGPKGPAKEAKAGALNVALKCNALIMSVSCGASRYWRLKSWDRTIIPKPFSTIYIRFNAPLNTQNINEHNIVFSVNNYLTTNLEALLSIVSEGDHD